MSILVLGDGAWGTALGIHLYRLGHCVKIWGAFSEYVSFLNIHHRNPKYLPCIEIPEEIEFITLEGLKRYDFCLVVVAIPVQFMRNCLKNLEEYLTGRQAIFVTVAKGIEIETLMRPTEIVIDVLGETVKVGGLYGPSHAEEVSQCIPTTLVATAADVSVAKKIQLMFKSLYMRIYLNTDVLGVELGSALKNVIAIAAGICDGLGFGDNTKAALITRGVVEMARFGAALGAQVETFYGLSGLGDLVATAFSKHSRNREVGERIGKGFALEEILDNFEKVAEGIWTSKAVQKLVKMYKLDMPISTKVFEVLFGNLKPKDAVWELMSRQERAESLR